MAYTGEFKWKVEKLVLYTFAGKCMLFAPLCLTSECDVLYDAPPYHVCKILYNIFLVLNKCLQGELLAKIN